MTPPELSRPLPMARALDGTTIEVTADAAECAAVAARLGLQAVKALRCVFVLTAAGGEVIAAHGRLVARVVQTCVVSLDAFEAVVKEEFRVRFVPAGTQSDDLDLDAEDEIPYDSGMIDLGEATTEQLALALDPFPRKPGARPAVDVQENGGAFAALGKLRKS